MQKLTVRSLSRFIRALIFWVVAVQPASAQWAVTQYKELAGVQVGQDSFAYICKETLEVFSLVTPNRLPVIGSWPNKRLPTTYRIDDGTERDAALFLRSEDLAKPQYIYTLVLDVRGSSTTMDDIIQILSSGNQLTVDMQGTEKTFPLNGFQSAANEVRMNCA